MPSAGAALLSGHGEGKTPPVHEMRLLKAAAVTLGRSVGTWGGCEATQPVDQQDAVTVANQKDKSYPCQLTGA
ncbi:hypothetical protein [Streptomyces justiciae]|uniref:hypothetical protein n=1 Tax=Streptomyces justiciae TaxID=2780140 RepID=UPI0021174C19|nr:hypothetical protein [Streptomyces justiciae]MCW8383392.1 hypothetical protein [Streptomyces justiciae]